MDLLSQDWVIWSLWFAAIVVATMLFYCAKALERIANILAQLNERDRERWVKDKQRQLELDDEMPSSI